MKGGRRIRATSRAVVWLTMALLGVGQPSAAQEGREAAEPARARLLAVVPGTASVEVTLTPLGDAGRPARLELSYGEPSGYRALPPARYEIEVRASGGVLARTTYGLGPGARYTLLIVGISGDSAGPGPATLDARLRWIFGGAEGVSPNGYLPQIRLLRDGKDVSPDRGHLRLVHGAPGVVALEARLHGGDRVRTVTSRLRYPRVSGPLSAPPGEQRLSLRLHGSPEPLLERSVRLSAGVLTTAVVVGGVGADRPLEIILLEGRER